MTASQTSVLLAALTRMCVSDDLRAPIEPLANPDVQTLPLGCRRAIVASRSASSGDGAKAKPVGPQEL